MIRLLVTAPLSSDPVRRLSAKGAAYATFSLRSMVSGADPVFVSCICFDDEAVAEVMKLSRGMPVSVTGRGELRTWTGTDAREQTGLSCTVERVLSMIHVKRSRKPENSARPQSAGGRIEDLPDDLPWRDEVEA